MASTLHYLTVQDILWINLQATKKVHHFNFAKLEEATFYQYAYGESNTLLPQAARFVSGFLRLHPLEGGNEVTAFISLLAFLQINGMDALLQDEGAHVWFGDVVTKRSSGAEALAAVAVHAEEADDHHAPTVRDAIKGILAKYPCTIDALANP